MSTTVVAIRKVGNYTFKVRYERQWSEWQVIVVRGSAIQHEKTYFAADKQDALDTMEAMANEHLAQKTREEKS